MRERTNGKGVSSFINRLTSSRLNWPVVPIQELKEKATSWLAEKTGQYRNNPSEIFENSINKWRQLIAGDKIHNSLFSFKSGPECQLLGEDSSEDENGNEDAIYVDVIDGNMQSVAGIKLLKHGNLLFAISFGFAKQVEPLESANGEKTFLRPIGDLYLPPSKYVKKARSMDSSWSTINAQQSNISNSPHHRLSPKQRTQSPPPRDKLVVVEETSWKAVDNEELLEAVSAELRNTIAVGLDDMLCVAAFWEMLHGIKSKKLRNGLLDGGMYDEEFKQRIPAAGIDSKMQRFCKFRYLRKNGKEYIVWLSYAREVKLREGTCIYSGCDQLYKIPQKESQAACLLGAEFSIQDEMPRQEQREEPNFDNLSVDHAVLVC